MGILQNVITPLPPHSEVLLIAFIKIYAINVYYTREMSAAITYREITIIIKS